jgi:hypothetical protein
MRKNGGLVMAVDWEIVRSLGAFAQAAATLAVGYVGWQGLKTWKRQHSFELARKILMASRELREFISVHQEFGFVPNWGKPEALRKLRNELESQFAAGYPLWSSKLEAITTRLTSELFELQDAWDFLEQEPDEMEPANEKTAAYITRRTHECKAIADIGYAPDVAKEFNLQLDTAFKELDGFLLRHTKV